MSPWAHDDNLNVIIDSSPDCLASTKELCVCVLWEINQLHLNDWEETRFSVTVMQKYQLTVETDLSGL